MTESVLPASGATALEYDATKTTGRRRAPSTLVAAEHVVLADSKRKKLLATVQDQVRNASVAAWMIRRHVDYVSKFRFSFLSGSDKLDKAVAALFSWHAQPVNFDIAGRMGREESFRMFEIEKVTAGDAAFVKITDGLKLQAIESDLIARPKVGKYDSDKKRYSAVPKEVADNVLADLGVILDPKYPGRIAKFCICSRGRDGKKIAYDHLEDAANVIFDAYYTRFSSQVRGVSPLSTAVNTIQDAYEGIDFNLAKSKAHALFGLAIMRDYASTASDQEEVDAMGAASGLRTGHDENVAGDAVVSSEGGTKSISATLQEIKPNEMMLVDMDLRGKIDTIESKNPSSEFQVFMGLVIRLALLALDIPYTAFDSRAASFAGMIADQNMYEVACLSKREKNKWARKNYSDWLISAAWKDDRWKLEQLAAEAKLSLFEVQELVEWVSSGTLWLQKVNEVEGDIKAIGVGQDNPIDSCKRRGSDFFENIDKTSKAYEYAKKKGVPLMIGMPGQATVASAAQQDAEAEAEDEGLPFDPVQPAKPKEEAG